MSLLSNKKGIIMGVANDRSIATSIATRLKQEGAELAFSYLPDDTGKMESRVRRAIEQTKPVFVAPCDVNQDNSIAEFFSIAKQQLGQIDFLVHSIAYAPLDDIRCNTLNASRAGFRTALDTSCYSLIATARAAAQLLNPGGSVLTLSYFGGEKVVPGYNLMGIAKSALEMTVRYLAYDLGEKGLRINGISAGPIKTLAASAVGDFGDMLGLNAAIAPLQRNVTGDEVGGTATYLLSSLASGVTGDIVHVDAGYHIMGGPGRALQQWGIKPREHR
jgi:enoyl-[acyl-carrier protein] reductase I